MTGLKQFKIRLLALWCAFIPLYAVAVADFGDEMVGSLTLADGLTGEAVNQVMTDHYGVTWIATIGGVNVFYGKHLHSFPIIGKGGWTLSVNDLCETSKHIYAATEEGLWQLSYTSGKFERVLPEIEQPLCLLAEGDTVYIGSTQGLMIYDGQQLKHIDIDVSRHGIDNIVRKFEKGEDGLIWFLGRFELNSYDPQTGKVKRYELAQPLNNSILSQFASLGNNRFVIGTRGTGLYVCDLHVGTARQVEGIGNIISTVQRSDDGHVCVATDGAGAYLLDGETLEVQSYYCAEGKDQCHLPSNGVYCYYRDANNVNWFGFVRNGLAYTYHSGQLFKVFHVGSFTSEGINVRTYCRHGEDIVLGTQNGFYYVNEATGVSRYFSPADLGGGHIVNTVVWYDGRFLIGTFDGGIREFSPKTMTLSRQDYSPLLDNVSIGELKVGPDDRLWIGFAHGLMIIGEGRLQQHFTEQNSKIVGGLILSITFDGSGNAWLTGASGCSLYSVRSHEIVETTFPEGFFNHQPWMRGAQGHDGLVRMRSGPQTFYTNEGMTDFGELKLPLKLSDKWSRSLVDDKEGHYLLASERGVLGINYDLSSIIQLGYGEGLRGSQINDMGIDKDGSLWVATSQGLFFTNLDSLTLWQNSSKYKVMLFDIRKGSDLLTMAEEYSVNMAHQISLDWNFTSEVLQAEAVLVDYAKQTGRLYEYRVDDGDWHLIVDGMPIDIRGMFLGKHRLEVRLAGAVGTSSEYVISVVPSGWAIFELVILLAALALLWLWWRYRKTTKVLLSERDEIEQALIEVEEELEKSEDASKKYQKVKLNEKECEEIVSRLKTLVENQKVYKNPELKMSDLAETLHLSSSKLSQIFSLYLKENYYDFINRYRLEEFKRLIAAGELKHYTITALSEECGFRKSSFFATFRKVEGMTPAEFLKKKNIKT